MKCILLDFEEIRHMYLFNVALAITTDVTMGVRRSRHKGQEWGLAP
jgi:hypothetical protein